MQIYHILQISLYKIHAIRKNEFLNSSDTPLCLCNHFLRYYKIMIHIIVFNLFFFFIFISCFISLRCNCWQYHGHNKREGYSIAKISFIMGVCVHTYILYIWIHLYIISNTSIIPNINIISNTVITYTKSGGSLYQQTMPLGPCGHEHEQQPPSPAP